MRTIVLIVEDEPDIRSLSVEFFESEGLVVFDAKSTDEALSLLESHPEIDVLLTDIDMPGTMDGLELAQVASSRWSEKRIVIVSSFLKPSPDKMPARSEFLLKPHNVFGLADRMRRCHVLARAGE